MSYLSQFIDNEQFRLASNAFPLIGKQKWDIGLAVHTDYRALSYDIGDVITRMVVDGHMQRLFAKYKTTYEMPPYYSQQ